VLHQLGTTTLDGASYTGACPERSRGDLAGNRKTRTDKRLGTTLTYAYDNIYQLLTAKQGTTTKESYTYDLVGNRLSSVGVTPYQYNASNQLTSIPGTTYTYDNNGNTKTKTTAAGTTTYTWDFENRLTQVALPGTTGTVTYKYDPFGRRVQKAFTQGGSTTTTNYLYDGKTSWRKSIRAAMCWRVIQMAGALTNHSRCCAAARMPITSPMESAALLL
jgi:YD repeat-containing protein